MKSKKLRPKGCKRTISGRHIPYSEAIGYTQIKVFCSACGIIDDTGVFSRYLFGTPKKIDDTKLDSLKGGK